MNELKKIRWTRVALLSGFCIASSTLLGTLSALTIFQQSNLENSRSLSQTHRRIDALQLQINQSAPTPKMQAPLARQKWNKWSQLQRKKFIDPKVQSAQKVSKLKLLGPGESQNKLIDIDVVDRDLGEVCEEIGRKVGRNIILSPGIEESVTLSLRDVHWTQTLEIVAKHCRCEITMGPGEIIVLTQSPHVTLEFSEANIRTVLMLLAAYTGKNIVIDPSIQGRVTLSLKDVHWEKAIQAICTVHGQFEIFEDKDGEILIAQRISGKHRR